MNVLFQAFKMYLNCLMHPCTLLKHVQFVNNVLMYIVLLLRAGRMAISAKSVHLFKYCINHRSLKFDP